MFSIPRKRRVGKLQGGREKYTFPWAKPLDIRGQTTAKRTRLYCAKGKQHCSRDNSAERRRWWGWQIRPRSPRPAPDRPLPPQQPPPATVRSFFFLFFFVLWSRGSAAGSDSGSEGDRGACVNQSPERRGAAARARAGGRAGGERRRRRARRPEETGRGRERKAETEERAAAEGLVQARPLRGDQEAGAALDNQHAEMVRSFHPPFLSIRDFGSREPPAARGAVFSPSPAGRGGGGGEGGGQGRGGEPRSNLAPAVPPKSPLNLAQLCAESSRWEGV